MVDNMAEDVAIVHQIPFTCDRIDNSTESMNSSSSDDITESPSFLHLNGKKQYRSQSHKQQRRFVATLEKVCY